MGLARRVNLHCADEVRATRTRSDGDSLNRKVGFARENLCEDPSHLDARGKTIDLDMVCSSRLAVTANGPFEGFRGARCRQDLLQLGQTRLLRFSFCQTFTQSEYRRL